MIETSRDEADILGRMLYWIIRRAGAASLLQVALLALVAGLVITKLVDLQREIEIQQLLPVGIIALPAGWVLARRFRPWLSLLIGFGGGVTFCGLQTASLWDEAWKFLTTFNSSITSALHWGPGRPSVDFHSASVLFNETLRGLTVLLGRAALWMRGIVNGQGSFDPIAAAMVWSMAVWVVCFWSSWNLRRTSNSLMAVTPSLGLLGMSLALSRASWTILIPVLAATLILMGVANYISREQNWERTLVDFSEELRLDMTFAITGVAAVLIFVAWLSPVVSIRRITQVYNSWLQARSELEERQLRESLGLEEPENTPAAGSGSATAVPQSEGALLDLRVGGMPRAHLLGTGPELSEEIVMWITTGEIPPGPEDLVRVFEIPRYYWRSLTYNLYTGRGWVTTSLQHHSYNEGEQAFNQGLPAQRQVKFSVIPAMDLGSIIYSAGDLNLVNQPYTIIWRSNPEQNGAADIFGAELQVPTSEYSAESWYSFPSPDELRGAGENYPPSILSQHLSIPKRVPDRVRRLAVELTATQPTAYDRAAAIERYLRQNYTYNLDVNLPPQSQDVVDYFLFDQKQGYCDYYASAMVVLARLAGLPARLAVGYAPGRYLPYEARYELTAADAHSWPEIYFPGYGWIIFEPTAGQPELDRIVNGPAQQGESEVDQERDFFVSRINWFLMLRKIGLAIGILAFARTVWLLSEPFRLSLLPAPVVMGILYRHLEHAKSTLDIQLPSGHTPSELGERVAAVFRLPIGTNRGLYNVLYSWLEPAPSEIERIVELYARTIYSQHPLPPLEKAATLQQWRKLRWRLLLKRFLRRIVKKGTTGK